MSDSISSYQAAAFDLDGTLVDTLPIHYEAYRIVLEALGSELTRERFAAAIGGPARDAIPRFVDMSSIGVSIDEIHRRKKRVTTELLATWEIPLLPCALLLDAFAGRCKIAVVSSGSATSVHSILTRLGWEQFFDAVVTGDDVERGKPAPEPFLTAAARLGVEPARCLVFEDSDDGVLSAQAAGMTVFDVRATTTPMMSVEA